MERLTSTTIAMRLLVLVLVLVGVVGVAQATLISTNPRVDMDMVVRGGQQGRLLYEDRVMAHWNSTGFYPGGGGIPSDSADAYFDRANQYSAPRTTMMEFIDEDTVSFQGNTVENITLLNVGSGQGNFSLQLEGEDVIKIVRDNDTYYDITEVQFSERIDMQNNSIVNLPRVDIDHPVTGAVTMTGQLRLRNIGNVCFAQFETFGGFVAATATGTIVYEGIFVNGGLCSLRQDTQPQPWGVVSNGINVVGSYVIIAGSGDIVFSASMAGGTFTSGQQVRINAGTIVASIGRPSPLGK